MTERTVITHSPEETQRLAGDLAGALRHGVIALHGELGAGKTCFVAGLAAALGIRRAVTSPTFTIANEYPGERPLYHIDLYRLTGPDEVLTIGLEEYLESDGLTAIEWPDRAAGLLPDAAVHVYIEAGTTPSERRVRIHMPRHAGPIRPLPAPRPTQP